MIEFTKMQGIGNDFIVINCLVNPFDEAELPTIAKKLNDRRFGIGGDGIVLVLPSKRGDLKMRMLNPDGSEAEMCGNGIRCFAKYVWENQISDNTSLNVETLAGMKVVKLLTRGNNVEGVRVDMGQPKLKRSEIPMRGDEIDKVVGEPIKVDGYKFDLTAVSMGNPHVVVFEDNVKAFDLERFGPQIENHKSFPQRTNVHVVQVVNNSEIIMRTWERGAGITLACGTGACACVVASVLNGKTGRRVTAHLPGGDLNIEWGGDNRVMMTGPAQTVFKGIIEV